jgi:hypothetical protein
MLLGRIIRAIKKLLFVESPHPASGDRKHFGFYEQGAVRFGYKHMEILLLIKAPYSFDFQYQAIWG